MWWTPLQEGTTVLFKRDFPIDITRHQLTPYQEQKMELDIQRNDAVVSTRTITNNDGKRVILVTLADKFAGNDPITISRRREVCEDILKRAHSRAGHLKMAKAYRNRHAKLAGKKH
jgi:hypothetical protein